MDVGGLLFGGLEIAMREAALFAAAGFAILGVGDVAVDAVWIALALRLRKRALPDPRPLQGPIAVFVPAWQEAGVIGPMLRGALAAWGDGPYRIFVGTYPNDSATIAAVAAVADGRVRLVVGCQPGPTTKADCLNRLWEALLAEETESGERARAVVLHDAEDVVHPAELRLFDALVGEFDLVQLPVVPLIDSESRWIGGHYADEFAEAHGKEMVVREAVGASLPSAGVGCAFSRDVLAAVAERSDGMPFDADSLTEDYELGLKVGAAAGRAAFVRCRDDQGRLIATREYFPGTLPAAVRQKARWMTGIALSGWDRLGWGGGIVERWMRLRDRQGLLAALLLFSGYVAMALWLVLKLRDGVSGHAPAPLPGALARLVEVNMALLAWRLALRCAFTARLYGPVEGLRAIPRALIGNAIAVLAAAAALKRYRTILRTGRVEWGKTRHVFPAEAAAE